MCIVYKCLFLSEQTENHYYVTAKRVESVKTLYTFYIAGYGI